MTMSKQPKRKKKAAAAPSRSSQYDRIFMRKEAGAKLRRLAEIEQRTMAAILDRLINEALAAAESEAK
jgi:hypothetical protein